MSWRACPERSRHHEPDSSPSPPPTSELRAGLVTLPDPGLGASRTDAARTDDLSGGRRGSTTRLNRGR